MFANSGVGVRATRASEVPLTVEFSQVPRPTTHVNVEFSPPLQSLALALALASFLLRGVLDLYLELSVAFVKCVADDLIVIKRGGKHVYAVNFDDKAQLNIRNLNFRAKIGNHHLR